MSTEIFEREKPTINVGTIGHVDHGKTTLTAALTRVCSELFGSPRVHFEQIDAAPKEVVEGVIANASNVVYTTSQCHYTHVDCPSNADYIKMMMTGTAKMDGAILVVSATDGPMPQTREHVLLCRETGVPYIIVFLNKADIAEDSKLLEPMEMEIRDLLSACDFPGESAPFIIGSARMALHGDDNNGLGTSSVKKLIEALDFYIPSPEHLIHKPFLLPIEDVFTIPGRGTMVTGRVERGVVNLADELEIVGLEPTRTTTCTGVKMFGKLLYIGQAGENCSVFLRGVTSEDVQRGQVLAKRATIRPHTVFTGRVYIFAENEGGRHEPSFHDYRPQFHFRTADVNGSCQFPPNVEKVMPGDNLQMNATLLTSVAMEQGSRFAIREGGRTVGVGVVTEIIE